MKKIYLISYGVGEYEDYREEIHSVWSSKKLAKKELNRITTYGCDYSLEEFKLDVRGHSNDESEKKCDWPRKPYSGALHSQAIFHNNFLKSLMYTNPPIFNMPFVSALKKEPIFFNGLTERYRYSGDKK